MSLLIIKKNSVEISGVQTAHYLYNMPDATEDNKISEDELLELCEEFRVTDIDNITWSDGFIINSFPDINIPPPRTILLNETFETDLSNWTKEFANQVYSGVLSANHAREGSKSLRIELRRTDANVAGSKRSEIARKTYEQPREDRYYYFSIYLPSTGEEEYLIDSQGSEIIAQWHNVPDSGEDWTSPPLALRTKANGNYEIERFWDDAPLSTNSSMVAKGFNTKHNIGSYLNDKGKWVDWIFHVKWGWLPEHNTILEVYKDGVLVLNCNGLPNTTNDTKGVIQKLGVYKWDWAQNPDLYSTIDKRVIYYDAVKVY